MANVSGIECVGVIVADPEKRFKPGQKAIALVRGMGKTINGSYAEFTCFSATNVASIECDLPWEEPAAIPEREKRDSSVSSEREKTGTGQLATARQVNQGTRLIQGTGPIDGDKEIRGTGKEIRGTGHNRRITKVRKVLEGQVE